MKKTILSIAIIATTLFASCKKDAKQEEDAPMAAGSISAKVNGSPWSGGAIRGTLEKNIALNNKVLTLSAGAKNKRITVTLLDAYPGSCFDLKTYDYGGFNNQATFAYDSILAKGDSSIGYYPIYGEFTVTDCNLSAKKLSGSFEFTMKRLGKPTDTLRVTGGVFTNVTYSVTIQ